MSATSPSPDRQNPLLAAWSGEFEMPPFAAIKAEHFRPAFDRALAEHRAEIDTIAQSRAEPSFENTIAALEKGGRELERVANVFFILAGADTSDDIEAIERDVSPLLARHNNALYLNPALYARIASLYGRRDSLGLSSEQARVLDPTTPDSCAPEPRSRSLHRNASPPSTSDWRASVPSLRRMCWPTRSPSP